MGILEDHINNYTRFEQPAVQTRDHDKKRETRCLIICVILTKA